GPVGAGGAVSGNAGTGSANAGAPNAAATAAGDAAGAGAAATQPASANEQQAKQLLDQAMTYIKENKYDLAEKSLNQVEGMRASLSPTLQSAVTQARTMLNTAKAGGGIKLPSLPGGAK
ncbi:MAG TPA: hypothetical protein VER17_13770, partial [Tepidisphaeraceae bacterium]|nr:hypothetical protein [Tepidisphaeraceae bacterium]